jgi:hypothetical protein
LAAENSRMEGHGVKLVMRRRTACIEKMVIMQRIGGDAWQNELVFNRIQFGHEQKSTKKSERLDLLTSGQRWGPSPMIKSTARI